MKTLQPEQVNDFVAGLDAVTDAEGFRKIIKAMYPKRSPSDVFVLLLLKKLKPNQELYGKENLITEQANQSITVPV